MRKKSIFLWVLLTVLLLCIMGCSQKQDAKNTKPQQSEKQLQPPALSLAEGNYESAQNLSITAPAGENIKIYYTLDDTDPTDKSKLYTKPLELKEDTKIKVIAIDAKGKKSTILSAAYRIDDKEAKKALLSAISGEWQQKERTHTKYRYHYGFGDYNQNPDHCPMFFCDEWDGWGGSIRVTSIEKTVITLEVYDFTPGGLTPNESDKKIVIDTGAPGDNLMTIDGTVYEYLREYPNHQ